MRETEKAKNKTLTTVDQSFKILEVLSEKGTARLNEISEHFDLPKSTAHIHLQTLIENGYVIHDENGYRLSLKFLEIGGHLQGRQKLVDISKDKLRKISIETGEKVDLMVEEKYLAVILLKDETDKALDENFPIGSHMHMHCIAMGKAMLATMPESEVKKVIERHGLPEKTPNTITDEDQLLAELDDIRERQFALNFEERFTGIRAIAVPLEANNLETSAAIGISGPRERLSEKMMRNDFVDRLLEVKNIIELQIDHH